MTRTLTAALAAALFAAFAVTAQAGDTLSGEDIRTTVTGKTIEGEMEATGAYAEYYAADGTIRGDGYTGTWSIDGDLMCFDYGEGADCWSVGGRGGEVDWIQNGAVGGTGTIKDGNPNDF